MNLSNFYIEQREKINDAIITLLEYRVNQTPKSRKKLENFFDILSIESEKLQLNELTQLAHSCKKWLKADKCSWSEKHYSYSLLLLGMAKLYTKINDLLEKEKNSLNQEYTRFTYTGNILILDKDVVTLDTLDTLFNQEGYKVNIASTTEKALDVINNQNIDIVIAETEIRGNNNLELVDEIEKNSPYTSIILMSKEENLEKKVIALQKGVEDLLIKPIKDIELKARTEQILKKKEHHQKDVNTDALTGAYTKRYFNMFSKELNAFSLAFIDLDDFKTINDTYGHLTGDKVLTKFCQLISENIRSEDKLFRFGGDEFVLAFPNTSKENAYKIIKKIKDVVSQNKIQCEEEENISIEVKFSCGISEKNGENHALEDVINDADKALYTVKNSSKNNISLYTETIASHKKKSALLVLKDPILEKLLENRLKNLKLSVNHADNVCQASHLLKNYKIDIAIVDIGFSDIEQSNVYQELSDKETKSLLLGETKDKAEIIKGLKMGIDDYIIKPFTLKELEGRIKKLI
ncbi:diguanylate cyclase [Proteinivorax tanatarense]|uniref:Stage 0 sporulation protein A homolog n=1 Tax=Proteinivorax tanatarense TaxID=1260629 RepID=A0AAU7VIG5_9FIRM